MSDDQELLIEVGKKYVDRRGRVYGPMFCRKSVYGESPDIFIWLQSGRMAHQYLQKSDMDLIDEYIEPVAEGLDQKPAEKALKELADMAGIPVGGMSPMEIADALIEENKPKPPKIEWYQHRRNESVVIQVHDRKTVFYVENGIYSPTFGYEDMKVNFGYQLTEEEALKLIRENTPKLAPVVESPDDWVELDSKQYAQHELRKGVDEIWYCEAIGWEPVAGYAGVTMEDYIADGTEKVRCRREDLPLVAPAPPVPQTIPVRLWTSHRLTFEGGDWPVRCGEQIPSGIGHHVEIKVGPNGFYIEKE